MRAASRQRRRTLTFRAAELVADTSREAHRHYEMLRYERAAIDDQLAEAMYQLLGDSSFHPLYPDTAETVTALHSAGVELGVVSDIHFDIRQHAQIFRIDHLIDTWVLSFELGVQKPDTRMFKTALALLDVDPSEALMVGDQVAKDGAAASIGIDTLILPAPNGLVPRGLDAVLRLVG